MLVARTSECGWAISLVKLDGWRKGIRYVRAQLLKLVFSGSMEINWGQIAYTVPCGGGFVALK